jgi:hypothetical protein
VPRPPSERRAWLTAGAIALVSVVVFVAILTGVVGRTQTVAPPPVIAYQPTPAPAPAPAAQVGGVRRAAGDTGAIVTAPSRAQQLRDALRFRDAPRTRIERGWMEGFYPIYATAQATFGVNWLLVASIHMQETAFSTAPSTYHGLNFAGCCGGPMQFNVTNGPVTTWDLVRNSYVYGRRPAAYDHMTARHPSIYDDFDAIMAGAHLLSADGAGYALDASAWGAAYDYYGHDATGVLYADEVIARAIGWSQHGFCANCGVRQDLVQAVDAAYGAPVRAGLELAAAPAPRATTARTRSARPRA